MTAHMKGLDEHYEMPPPFGDHAHFSKKMPRPLFFLFLKNVAEQNVGEIT